MAKLYLSIFVLFAVVVSVVSIPIKNRYTEDMDYEECPAGFIDQDYDYDDVIENLDLDDDCLVAKESLYSFHDDFLIFRDNAPVLQDLFYDAVEQALLMRQKLKNTEKTLEREIERDCMHSSALMESVFLKNIGKNYDYLVLAILDKIVELRKENPALTHQKYIYRPEVEVH